MLGGVFGKQAKSNNQHFACTLLMHYLSVFGSQRGKKRRKHQEVSRKWRKGFVGMAKFTMRWTHVSQLEEVLEYRGKRPRFHSEEIQTTLCKQVARVVMRTRGEKAIKVKTSLFTVVPFVVLQ